MENNQNTIKIPQELTELIGGLTIENYFLKQQIDALDIKIKNVEGHLESMKKPMVPLEEIQ